MKTVVGKLTGSSNLPLSVNEIMKRSNSNQHWVKNRPGKANFLMKMLGIIFILGVPILVIILLSIARRNKVSE